MIFPLTSPLTDVDEVVSPQHFGSDPVQTYGYESGLNKKFGFESWIVDMLALAELCGVAAQFSYSAK